MPIDWIQSRDAAFQLQAHALVAAIASHADAWGLHEKDLSPLQHSTADFDEAMGRQAEQAALYHAAVADKQARREGLERTLRRMVRRINNHPGMTDELRKCMGLASPTRNPTNSACRAEASDEGHE